MTAEDEKRKHEKEMFKQAADEWLDKKFASFGKWSLGGIAAIVFIELLKFIVDHNLFGRW